MGLLTLPETKPASLHLKMDVWNTIRLLLGHKAYFQVPTVSFRESRGSSQDLYVVIKHGDRKSSRPGVVGPLPNGRTSWLINGGY